jgi:hypothetical protein
MAPHPFAITGTGKMVLPCWCEWQKPKTMMDIFLKILEVPCEEKKRYSHMLLYRHLKLL